MAARAPRLLLGCHVYTSEGRDARVISRLRDLCRAQPGVLLASSFVDEPYHRSSYTLVSRSADALVLAAVTVAEAALAAIDLRAHDATHPRLGAVDHISCHPVPATLNGAHGGGGDRASSGAAAGPSGGGGGGGGGGGERDSALGAAGQVARGIGRRLASSSAALPVYYYGHAHPERRRLAEVRRQLGYFGFTDSSRHAWQGEVAAGRDLSQYPPDDGPGRADPRKGVITIGAVPWIINFNVPLATSDMGAARRVARAVSERGGGLPAVEAMALAHSPGVIEVACNLLDPEASPPKVVQAAIEAAARSEGLVAVEGGAYVIGKLPEEITAAANAQLP